MILQQLSQGFTCLVLSMQGQNLLTDTPDHITSMLQLLLAMAKRQTLVVKVLDYVKEAWIDSIFSTIMDDDEENVIQLF